MMAENGFLFTGDFIITSSRRARVALACRLAVYYYRSAFSPWSDEIACVFQRVKNSPSQTGQRQGKEQGMGDMGYMVLANGSTIEFGGGPATGIARARE